MASVLFALPARVRQKIFAGAQHTCPVCNSELRQFLVLHRSYHLWCAVCRSLQRHRLIWLAFQQPGLLALRQRCRMLHIAPEECLAQHFRRMDNVAYLSGGLDSPSDDQDRIGIPMDICAIAYPANSFDFILCSHVLEHAADDRQAMRELFRVLSPGGQALILVPIFFANNL